MKCVVELFGDDRNGRKMIAWGRRIGCADAGHVFDADRRKVATRLVVDDANPSQKSYLLEKEHLKEAPEDRVLAQVLRKRLTLLCKFALYA